MSGARDESKLPSEERPEGKDWSEGPMASTAARRKVRYSGGGGTYGSLAYAEPAVHPMGGAGSEVLLPRPRVRPRERVAVRPKVRVREAGQVSVFAVVGFLAVGVFAVLLMLSMVRLATVGDEVVSLKSSLTALQTDQKKLLAQYELAYDLSAIEQKVTANGSMVKPQAGQIDTLDLSEADSVVRYDQKDAPEQEATGLPQRLQGLAEKALAYFR